MAKLRQKWWDDLEPEDLKCSLSQKLKQYQNAVKAGNIQGIYEQSRPLADEIIDTRAKIRKMDSLDKKEKKTLDNELLALNALLGKDLVGLRKSGSTQVQIFDKNISKIMGARLKSKLNLTQKPDLGGIHLRLKVPLYVVQTLEYNNQETELFRRVETYIEAFMQKIEDEFDSELKRAQGLALNHAQTSALERMINENIRALETSVSEAPRDVIRKGKDLAGIAKEYKTDRAVNITLASLGVMGSAAALAAPGTQAVAIVGLIRAAAKLVEEIVKVAMNVKAKAEALEKNIQNLVDSYNKGWQTGKELGATTLNAILGANAVATIDVCKDRMGDLKKHLAYVMNRNNMLEGIIKELLVRLPALKKDLEACTASKAYAKKAKVWLHLKTLRKKFDLVLKSVANTNGRITAAEFSLVRIKGAAVNLTDNAKGVQALAKVIPIFVNIGLSIGSAADGIIASTKGLNIAANTIGVANDLMGEIKDNIG